MADGVKQFAQEMGQAAGEVARDVKDSVGEMIEQGAQSTVGSQLTPQQIQQQQQAAMKKETDRQKNLAYTRKWLKDLEISQNQVRMENEQKLKQRIQAQEQEQQKKVQQTPVQLPTGAIPQKRIREDIAENMPELRGGHGKGG